MTTPAVPAQPSAEIIAIRAYQIFEARGGAPGDALADWLQAEAELTAAPPPARRKTQAARAASV